MEGASRGLDMDSRTHPAGTRHRPGYLVHPEFVAKKYHLGLYLFNMNNGPCASWEEVLDSPDYGQDYVDNYLNDADVVLRTLPHLLGLEAREAMFKT
jgi:hypothetical protein